MAKSQQSGYGGMVTVALRGGLDQARVFLSASRSSAWPSHWVESRAWPSTVRSLNVAVLVCLSDRSVACSAIMTHASVPAEHRAKLGISDALVRLSCGIEDGEDLVADVMQALEAVPDAA